jgi:hypothetical protein
MKVGTFTRWLKEHHPNAAFNKDGSISKVFVRSHYKKWSLMVRRKAVFFLNSVKR